MPLASRSTTMSSVRSHMREMGQVQEYHHTVHTCHWNGEAGLCLVSSALSSQVEHDKTQVPPLFQHSQFLPPDIQEPHKSPARDKAPYHLVGVA